MVPLEVDTREGPVGETIGIEGALLEEGELPYGIAPGPVEEFHGQWLVPGLLVEETLEQREARLVFDVELGAV